MTTRWTAIIAGVAGTALVGAGTAAAADQGSSTAGSQDLTVLCDGIGEDVVTISGDLSAGGTATIADGPLRVVGQPGFTGKDARGRSVRVAPTGQGATCTARTTTRGASVAALLPRGQAGRVGSTGQVSGTYTFTVEVDLDEVAGAQSTDQRSATTSAEALPFESKLRSYLAGRPGAVGVAVRLPGTGRAWTYTKTSSRNVTASIVKVEIMAAVMLRAQDSGRSLTSWEKSKIVPMIRYSDNAATTDLFNSIGGRAGLDRASSRLGLYSTHADPAGHWGLTSTNAADQAKLMEHFARATGKLTYANRSYGLYQMRRVASSQDWGVSAGPPDGYVALKNGWLPRTDGWHVNSIGWQSYGKADYTIGVLTSHNPGSMSTQIATIEGVSRIVWDNRTSLLGSSTPPSRGRSGDVTGDGKPDVLTLSTGGNLYLYAGDGSGRLAAKKVVKYGLGGYSWVGNAGDLNRDGRSDVLLRYGSDLRVMFATSSGGFTTPKKVGTFFAGFTDLAAGHDVDGNGKLDLIARKPGGEIWRYELSDTGVPTKKGSMGTPARYYPNIDLVADVNGDKRADMRGVASGGRMRTWTAGTSSWSQTSQTSTGWERYATVETPGDLNLSASKQDDVVAITPGGTVHLYYGTAGGGASGPTSRGTIAYGMTRVL